MKLASLSISIAPTICPKEDSVIEEKVQQQLRCGSPFENGGKSQSAWSYNTP